MRDVILHGDLAARYGECFRLDVQTPAEAFRALFANFPQFKSDIRQGEYQLVIGKDAETGLVLGKDDLTFRMGRQPFHIIPVAAGSKSAGATMKVVVGVLILAVATYFSFGAAAAGAGATGAAGGGAAAGATATGFATTAFTIGGAAVTWGNIALFGAALAFSGVSMLTSPQPGSDFGDREAPDQRPSFLFNDAVNTSQQGGPVPILIGEHIAGSQVGSAGLIVEEIDF